MIHIRPQWSSNDSTEYLKVPENNKIYQDRFTHARIDSIHIVKILQFYNIFVL